MLGIVSICYSEASSTPNNEAHGANMGPIWGRKDPGEPHVGPMILAIWVDTKVHHSDQ